MNGRRALGVLALLVCGSTEGTRAQQQEVGYSSSPAWQAELARAQGLGLAGEQTYAIESAAAVAGPGAAEQGVAQVGSVIETMARATVAIG